jgi:hypothetical protein
MKITVTNAPVLEHKVKDGEPFYARRRSSGLAAAVAIRSPYGVVYFNKDTPQISYSSVEYFDSAWEVVRPFTSGDTLSISG